MYKEHDDISTPVDATVIWRYMSIEKYLSLLVSQELFLCRVDGFDDPWEGVWPRKQLDKYLRSIDKASQDESNELKRFMLEHNRKCMFVHCWHANNSESAAMWDLYSSRESGVAIRSTVGRIKDSLDGEGDVFIGSVEYIDYDDETITIPWMTLAPAFLKRASFTHENEVRLMCRHYPLSSKNSDGVRAVIFDDALSYMTLKVNVNTLISDVYLSPTMEPWLASTLIEISKKYGVDKGVFKQSKLYDGFVL
ncbi:hypothetical protein ACVBEG_15120 [Pseudomonas sp. GG8]